MAVTGYCTHWRPATIWSARRIITSSLPVRDQSPEKSPLNKSISNLEAPLSKTPPSKTKDSTKRPASRTSTKSKSGQSPWESCFFSKAFTSAGLKMPYSRSSKTNQILWCFTKHSSNWMVLTWPRSYHLTVGRWHICFTSSSKASSVKSIQSSTETKSVKEIQALADSITEAPLGMQSDVNKPRQSAK